MPKWVSPNEIHKAACDEMLDGREPQNALEWSAVVNFYAAQVDSKLADSAVQLLCKLMDCPLTPTTISKIVDFQIVMRLLNKVADKAKDN